MADGLVSVIIPVYNRENTIIRAIDSVLCQSYPDLEVIVVDDGSADSTAQRVSQYTDPRVRLIRQEHGGADKARNLGIRNAGGAYIAFQDSDDEWLPEKLDIQIAFMEDSGYQVCFCPYYLHENNSVCAVPFDYADKEKYQAGLPKILTYRNIVSTQTLVIKREVLAQLGSTYFDEQMPRWQDYEFAIRLLKAVPVGYVDMPLVNVYCCANSISADSKRLYQAAALMIRKHLDFMDVNRFLDEFFKSYDVLADFGGDIIEGLNLIQDALEAARLGDCVNVKDMLITYMAGQSKAQRAVDEKESIFRIGNLQDRNFFIYGAGKIGQEVCQKLKAKGLRPLCFVVTKDIKNNYIDGIPVIRIDENKEKNYPVIIAISKEHQAELRSNLVDRGYQHFFTYYGAV